MSDEIEAYKRSNQMLEDHNKRISQANRELNISNKIMEKELKFLTETIKAFQKLILTEKENE